MQVYITTPMDVKVARGLSAGDSVFLSGTIYTARDAAHKRLCEMLGQGEKLPFEIKDAIIYYVGPTPNPPGHITGSAGPTSSYRMDAYAPRLMELGLRGMIGKGIRSNKVIESMKKHGAVYFGAIGGAGALVARTIKKSERIAFDDLDSEAIHRYTVKNMPLTVVIDSQGRSLYKIGRENYLNSINANL